MTISDRFSALRAQGEQALVLFVTAGDPPLDQLPSILEALQEGGADILEIGIPFSDPIADGPTIQASSQRALDRGVTPRAVLDTLARCDLRVPTVLMGYWNPVLRWGVDDFARAAAEAGANGSIITDLTPEEADAWVIASRAHGLDNVFLAAPTSTDARLDEVVRRASGFVYAVSRTGVTGSDRTAPPEVASLVQRLRARTSLPIAVGFGISRPEHVRAICAVADGAVIGSALVTLLADAWAEGRGHAEVVRAVREWKTATQP